MKSNSITGLAFALFPHDTTNQTSQFEVDKAISDGTLTGDTIISGNNFYLFEGDMPPAETLQAFTDTVTFLAAYSSKQILKIESMDIRWTYDKKKKQRKLEKWPVNAEEFSSAVDGIAKWAAIEIEPKSLSTSEKLLMFTDAVGAWEDVDQSVLVSNTAVIAGEAITVKSINITVQDALVFDLAKG